MRFHIQPGAARRSRRGVVLLGAAVVLSALMACDSLLNVSSPSRIPASSIENPQNSVLLASGAKADFDCALGAFIVVGGELTDEFEDATQTASRWVYDQRSVPSDASQRYASSGCESEGTYIPLNQARESADAVARMLNNASDADMPAGVNRDSLIAVMSAYAGYSRVLLGEMFCSAVISTLNPDGTITYGTEITPAQMFASADSMFTNAINLAPDATIRDLAYVGRARAQLDLGQYAAASTDAQQVPDGFLYQVDASTINVRRENRIWDESNLTSAASSVGPRYQHMMYDGVPDPRIQADSLNSPPTATGVIQWAQMKYPSGASPIPVARWAEAQLIIAEADARSGDATGAIAVIDTLHARAGIPAYSGSTNADSVLAAVIDERSRELWLEGQRLYDVIRNDLQIDPAAGSPYRNGGVYGPAGSQLCLKLPDNERQNNPNLGG